MLYRMLQVLLFAMLLVLPAGCRDDGHPSTDDGDAALDGGVVDAAIDGASPDSGWDAFVPTGELLWEADDESATGEAVNISDVTYHCLVGWHVNNQAWEYYSDTGQAAWRHDLGDVDGIPQDMTSDGAWMAGGAGNAILKFEPPSAAPVWSHSMAVGETVYSIAMSNDGDTIYHVSGVVFDHMNITSFDVPTSSENWSHPLPENGYSWGFALSANGERLVVVQYDWISVYSRDGDELLRTETQSQTQPSISDDGNVFVTGDLHGYVIVREYNGVSETYDERWTFQFEPGEFYDWASAVAISGDGSTVAAGSLQFEGNGLYRGELAVFDSDSDEPLWVYSCNDDQVSAIDMSQDGAVIAVASWGPLQDENNDFWVFAKSSNVPFFEHNCTGSMSAVDLSADGTRCIAGGKAVHRRTMGHGGKVYYFALTVQ